jgi:hypothetical protein
MLKFVLFFLEIDPLFQRTKSRGSHASPTP